MRMSKKQCVVCLMSAAMGFISLFGCGNEKSSKDNAIYYWRTTFRLNNYERDFLKKHNINKMYVKFFDVDKEWGQGAIPVGTTIFIDSFPKNIEIVPTVFITSEAIKYYPEFSDKLLKRVEDMADVNGINFSEIQIDCDWKESAAEKYFAFMKDFKSKLEKKDIKLSTTIRLSQFGYETPAADYGVLMCYNTGDIKKWETANSILDIEDIKLYLEKIKSCKLPLSVAFPNFGWDVSFTKYSPDDSEYYMEGIEYDKNDFSDECFEKISENHYKMSKKSRYYGNVSVYIRHEEVTADDVLEAKKLIWENLSSAPKQIILYHLDSANLSKFSDNEVEKIYR